MKLHQMMKTWEPLSDDEKRLSRGLLDLYREHEVNIKRAIKNGTYAEYIDSISDKLYSVLSLNMNKVFSAATLNLADEFSIFVENLLHTNLDKLVATSISGIINTIKSGISRTAQGLYTAGLSDAAIHFIFDKYLGTNRVNLIAITETTRAKAEGTEQYSAGVYNQHGIKLNGYWYTSRNEMVCDICAPLHQSEIYTPDGLVNKPKPPAHPGCKCEMVLRKEPFPTHSTYGARGEPPNENANT